MLISQGVKKDVFHVHLRFAVADRAITLPDITVTPSRRCTNARSITPRSRDPHPIARISPQSATAD